MSHDSGLPLPHGFGAEVEQVLFEPVESMLSTEGKDGFPFALNNGLGLTAGLRSGPINHFEDGLQDGVITING